MKFLNLAISAIGLVIATASTQAAPIPVVYDTYEFTGVTQVSYTMAGLCAGDTMSLVGLPPAVTDPSLPPMYVMQPTDTWDTLKVLFVALAPGTFNISASYFSSATLTSVFPCDVPGSPIVIPAAGVWEVEFCFGGTPIGNNLQGVSIHSGDPNFRPAFVNMAAIPGLSDVPFNSFLLDRNGNHNLEPAISPTERVTFTNPGSWNLAAQLATTGCAPAPQFACSLVRSVSVRPVPGMRAVEEKFLTSASSNNKL